ncbi:MAG: CehA/McbA family metallohydrolase [Pirellulaceae bacterium]|jgi:hypothetical protein|nr:CehA/McbA family metallohydrolase [Pirellulaceae bacterium]
MYRPSIGDASAMRRLGGPFLLLEPTVLPLMNIDEATMCFQRAAYSMVLSLAAAAVLAKPALAVKGELEISVVDRDTGEPIAVRMHLKNQRGRFVKPPGLPFWKDHFVFSGKVVLKLSPGPYTFEMERGPEYQIRRGNFLIRSGALDNKEVDMVRFTDMKSKGWWSGDLHIHRPVDDIKMLMLAEDLHIGPVITWWNNRNAWEKKEAPESLVFPFGKDRFFHVMAGEDEREGGALLYFNLGRPLPITGASREHPSPIKFLKMARRSPEVHVDIEKPFWWDMPIWIASEQVDSIGLANNHQWRTGMLDGEAWGKPRDKLRFPSPHGNGRWTESIYYRLLNCGIRLPPSAGSASGVLNNPVGYNRVYAHVEGQLTWEKWWRSLREGRVVVTNGPLIRPLVNGELPGHVFQAAQGESVDLSIQLELALREKVDYLEVVKNGKVVHEVRLDDYKKKRGKLPNVEFTESGWLLVRAVADNPVTYRFASTGPYYVEIGEQPRISKGDAQFFLDWVHERVRRVKLEDAAEREEVVRYHRAARDFWQKIVDKANAE